MQSFYLGWANSAFCKIGICERRKDEWWMALKSGEFKWAWYSLWHLRSRDMSARNNLSQWCWGDRRLSPAHRLPVSLAVRGNILFKSCHILNSSVIQGSLTADTYVDVTLEFFAVQKDDFTLGRGFLEGLFRFGWETLRLGLFFEVIHLGVVWMDTIFMSPHHHLGCCGLRSLVRVSPVFGHDLWPLIGNQHQNNISKTCWSVSWFDANILTQVKVFKVLLCNHNRTWGIFQVMREKEVSEAELSERNDDDEEMDARIIRRCVHDDGSWYNDRETMDCRPEGILHDSAGGSLSDDWLQVRLIHPVCWWPGSWRGERTREILIRVFAQSSFIHSKTDSFYLSDSRMNSAKCVTPSPSVVMKRVNDLKSPSSWSNRTNRHSFIHAVIGSLSQAQVTHP